MLLLTVLSACNLSTSPPGTPTPDLNIPLVQITFPANDANVIEGTDLRIEIAASDEAGDGIARVELRVDDTLVNERGPDISSAVPVFTVNMNWLAQGLGRHAITAIAYRTDGVQSDETTIVVNVLADEVGAPATTPEQ